jgi:hypothetical protein
VYSDEMGGEHCAVLRDFVERNEGWDRVACVLVPR